MIDSDGKVVLVCAVRPEAKPLIEYFDLKEKRDSGFSFEIYHSEDKSLWLLIGGLGQLRMSFSMGYFAAHIGDAKNIAWLNIGIAGHKNFEFGSGYWVHKISSRSAKRSFYPALPSRKKFNCDSHSLMTVDKVETEYGSDDLYDMEAYSFFNFAKTFSPIELIQLFKVVSDNNENHIENLTKEMCSHLIEKKISEIELMIADLKEKSKILRIKTYSYEDYQSLTSLCHFTITQKEELKKLMTRAKALGALKDLKGKDFTDKKAKEILKFYRSALDNSPIDF